MLLELRLENYAVIDNVVVEFAAGLNLLTGETGAGKSILIDALALLLGDKSSTDVVRHGADRAIVAAVFETQGGEAKRVAQVLEANGLDSEGDEIIVRREIASNGKGRVFVNNQPATLAVLRQLAPSLAIIHAQNESLVSFNAAVRLELLDQFAESDLQPVEKAFAEWTAVRRRIAELEGDEQDRLRLLDLWNFQKNEIEAVRPQPGEDELLETEKRVLASAEKIYTAAMAAYDLLYEGASSAAASLRAAQRQIEVLAQYEPKFLETQAAVDSARINVEDVGTTLRDYAAGIQASPERLAEIEDRLAALAQLKRKYGATITQVIAFAADLARKLDEMDNKDDVLRQLHLQLATAGEHYVTAARSLSKRRLEAARKLEKLVEHEVNQLAMKAQFKIAVTASEEESRWTTAGFDQTEYLIATNPGEPLKPLEQIASGGELSRVMLALKASVEVGTTGGGRRRSKTAQRTLVFDEIDTGIGGGAAEAVGRKLKELAQSSQVVCVTHLPQIATFADQHYLIEKKTVSGRTRASVRRISGAERTEEVARMLSGAALTEASRKNAEQMLKANA